LVPFSRPSHPSHPNDRDLTSSPNQLLFLCRRRTADVHQAKLERFSWAASWRRFSSTSQYSPRGSRVHSRQPSAAVVAVGPGETGASDSAEGRAGPATDKAEREGQGGGAAAGERPVFLEPHWEAAERGGREGGGGGAAFTQRELDEAVKRAEQRGPA
jgi:hypothetical protein